MNIKNLENTNIETLVDCFFKAFENYFVPIPNDRTFWKKRWQLSKVDYRFSYGMFDNEKLVGFIINAIDKRNGELIAFNTGTGVLPAYRGQRIVQAIYNFALKEFKQHGIVKCSLEVIKENSIAIKAYQSIGFSIQKEYKCYKGEISLDSDAEIEVREVNYNQIDWNTILNQALYSWDNHSSVLKNGDYKYFYVLNKQKPESYFVLNTSNKYLAQWDVFTKDDAIWKRLFLGIKQTSKFIKINNIDNSLTHKIAHLNAIGLENTINQYEMELKIK